MRRQALANLEGQALNQGKHFNNEILPVLVLLIGVAPLGMHAVTTARLSGNWPT
jgi:hypothetical protein